jgi:hypothetical protein
MMGPLCVDCYILFNAFLVMSDNLIFLHICIVLCHTSAYVDKFPFIFFVAARMASDIDISSYDATDVNNKGANTENVNELLIEKDMSEEIIRMIFFFFY